MKLFDYKFLILLGLSLALYFVFREVEHVKFKLQKLEYEFKTKFGKNECILNSKPKLDLPNLEPIKIPNNPNNLLNNLNNSPNNLPNNPNNSPNNSPNNLSNNLNTSPKLISVNVKDSELNHVEIYSNDDEHNDDNINSLLESVEATKKNKLINNILKIDDLETKDLETKDLETKDLETKDLETKDLETKDLENTLTEEKLNTLKINELKKMAEDMKLNIKKKTTKQDLIQLILKK